MKINFFLLFLISSINLFSQEEGQNEKFISKKNDRWVISFLNSQLTKVPHNMKVMPVSLGIDVQYFQQLLKKNRTLNLSIGLEISTHNIHNNALPYDSVSITFFRPIPAGYEYTKNKLTVCYVELPLEIDIVSKTDKRNRNFKLALGGKFGLMLTNYIKYSGEDFRNHSNHKVKFKEYNFDNINKFDYGIYSRLTFDRIGLNVNYSLSKIFINSKGPKTSFFSYGLCISI